MSRHQLFDTYSHARELLRSPAGQASNRLAKIGGIMKGQVERYDLGGRSPGTLRHVDGNAAKLRCAAQHLVSSDGQKFRQRECMHLSTARKLDALGQVKNKNVEEKMLFIRIQIAASRHWPHGR